MVKIIQKTIFLFLMFSIPLTGISRAENSNSIKKVDQIGTETLNFISNLKNTVPAIIQELNSSKGKLDLMLLNVLRKSYKDIGLTELLLSLLPFKKNNLNDRLLPLFGYLAIEALLITAISNLEKLKKADALELNQKIEDYISQIKTKINELKTVLNESFIKLLGLENNLSTLETSKSEKSDTAKKILEECQYKKLTDILKIEAEKLKDAFCSSILKIFSCILKPADHAVLNNFVNGNIFKKIKNATTEQTFTTLSDGVLSGLPDSAKKIVEQAKSTIIANTTTAQTSQQ